MKALRIVLLTCVHAVLHLRPPWLARLFGAPDLVVELEYMDLDGWVSKYTRRALAFMTHSEVIRAAMEGYPLEGTLLPAACLLKE